jgi:putative flippase GtrA
MREQLLLDRLPARHYLKYLAASATALAVDVGCFTLLIWIFASAIICASASYLAGLAVHWTLCRHVVFSDRIGSSPAHLQRQRLLYLASAALGLALTAAIAGLGESLGFSPAAYKLGAVLVSFNATYLFRRTIVFPP